MGMVGPTLISRQLVRDMLLPYAPKLAGAAIQRALKRVLTS